MKVLGIIAAVVIVGGTAAFFMMNQQPNTEGTEVAQNQATATDGAFSGSLADLMGRGGDWQCTFNVENQVSKSSGTVYVSGEKLRGDFASRVPQLNQTIDSHMVQSGGYVYVWTSMTPQGFKTKSAIGTPDGTTAFNDQGIDINQQYAYTCTPWTADAALFELPAGVTFAGG